ncbi:MAG: hypothetical protein A2787_05365 [Omnitrophica WOR_2 bacterium RIFCSPHIGHO2_01_FULL_48_9]|nr:MAG: hypothetical protein A3D10_01535 [Omnitrophica WOR_2 bacterium RIFCSPHIGHO2_02_FULL_48_11]OGX34032.1 MAG: hypothetical protein A2787_05365 [Omnitrophica WOR_2 bacterium RIFCSPHIGHO2_01_FULL_48_9]
MKNNFSILKIILFLFFFISGFCSLLYQIVWIRLAYATFGVITPVLSVVISVFMLGLSLGSWFGGKWIDAVQRKSNFSPLFLYALTELFIGFSPLIVPQLFSFGEQNLLSIGEMNSATYLFFSGFILAISILPWCIFMGFTFPFMMAFIQRISFKNKDSFSYLYFANVIGAMAGTLLTALVLIESLGFSRTLWIGACLNFTVAIISFILTVRYPITQLAAPQPLAHEPIDSPSIQRKESLEIYSILFMTGFLSMAMEVVWTRAFTPVMGTLTYSFASLLAVYLLATWIGSFVYRRHLKMKTIVPLSWLLAYLSIFSFLPIVLNDPRIGMGIPRSLISIFPYCAVLGYLTPNLIDHYSSGQPMRAGKVYAYNIVGCILGPLIASYILLPVLGVRLSLLVLAMPILLFFLTRLKEANIQSSPLIAMAFISLLLLFCASFVNLSYEDIYERSEVGVVRRDYAATVISAGEGMRKQLLINGIGITSLTPITKIMAHLPLSLYPGKPASTLVICFGMGTTYRSLLSWDIETNAVELVPSVRDAFEYYFDDAPFLLNHPKGKIIIDDGRRFLKRTNKRFDVITLDPPPPVEAAGSSLLYSEQFYAIAKSHLTLNGVLQQWFPGGELSILQAVSRSIHNSFPYVKVFYSIEGWGYHFLASQHPIQIPTIEEFIARMPETARKDLREWYGETPLEIIVKEILNKEIPISAILNNDPQIRITDDIPYNEYYLLRRLR